jgi:plastocyanin
MKRLTMLCLIAGLAAAGCGGSSNNSSGSSTSAGASTGASTSAGGGSQLALAADPSALKFDKSQLSATAGKVTITMTNPSPLEHDIALKGGVNEKGQVVGQGGKSVVTADLKPGQYTFYCSVDGHEAAGMTGTLTVK